ncbi:MAG: type I-E CRISPR-associated protein Cse2/CasB [Puniceicoccales bacterium]|jgi:CRISPR type I-E-associated protein CasB/Cse2|nr:type I-E CRISPR-associated protein Cse2/CasB [Puniceicoccales bacterium]
MENDAENRQFGFAAELERLHSMLGVANVGRALAWKLRQGLIQEREHAAYAVVRYGPAFFPNDPAFFVLALMAEAPNAHSFYKILQKKHATDGGQSGNQKLRWVFASGFGKLKKEVRDVLDGRFCTLLACDGREALQMQLRSFWLAKILEYGVAINFDGLYWDLKKWDDADERFQIRRRWAESFYVGNERSQSEKKDEIVED